MSVNERGVVGLAGLLLVAVTALAAACAGRTQAAPPTADASPAPDASPTCNSKPFDCPIGQTCVATSVSDTFACFDSGPGQVGASCRVMVDRATCGDYLVCLQSSPAAGICAAYCEPMDPMHACSGGATCTPVAFNGGSTAVTFYVCVDAPVADAGGSG
jgi:hypothetical protein